MVSTRPLISKSSNPCTNPLVTVPSATIKIGITVTFMFHRFLFFTSSYLSLFLSVLPCGLPEQQCSQFGRFSLFGWLSLGLVVWSRFDDPFVSQNSWGNLCISFSRAGSGLWIYHLFVWSNFLQHSQWTTFPTQSCLVLYSFCTNLLHSFYDYRFTSITPLSTFAICCI